MILSIFIVFISAACVSCQHCPEYQVIQPQYQTVNQDGSAFISCEHNANVFTMVDVRLNSCWQDGQGVERTVLCQKGRTDCENIALFLQTTNKSLFILRYVDPEAMNITYECQMDPEEVCDPLPQHTDLRWILIGLLCLLFLYGCVITCVFIRLRMTSKCDPDNPIYVDMRKGPLMTK